MAISISTVIEQARELRPQFHERSHPLPTCERFVTRYARELIGKLRLLAVEAVAVEETISMPLADYAAGYTFPAFMHVLPVGFAFFGEYKRRLTLIGHNDREASQHWPSFYFVGNTLFLAHEETDWATATQLIVRYVPESPLGGSGELALPAEADSTVIAALAAFLAGREPALQPADKRELKQDAVAAEQAFLRSISTRLMPAVNVVEEW